jgi:hypothetical protein
MNVKSVKRTFGLAATAVGASGAMMLAPAVANAATAQPTHVQTVNNVSRASFDDPGLFSSEECGCDEQRSLDMGETDEFAVPATTATAADADTTLLSPVFDALGA